jgi:hypothetical protein
VRPALVRLGKQLPRVLRENGIDEHQLRAYRAEMLCWPLVRARQLLDDWALVHRNSLTGASDRGAEYPAVSARLCGETLVLEDSGRSIR